MIALAKVEILSVQSVGGEAAWDIHTGSSIGPRYYIVFEAF
jgi:hypothetical protein